MTSSGNNDASKFLKGCTNREIRVLVKRALGTATGFRITKSGIILYGPNGTAAAHRSQSDHRAVKNFKSDLRRAGIAT